MKKILVSILFLSIYSYSNNKTSIIQFTQLNYTDIRSEIFFKKGEKLRSIISQLNISNEKDFFKYLKLNNALDVKSYELGKLITNYKND